MQIGRLYVAQIPPAMGMHIFIDSSAANWCQKPDVIPNNVVNKWPRELALAGRNGGLRGAG